MKKAHVALYAPPAVRGGKCKQDKKNAPEGSGAF